ncbi:MAG: gamma carbonic anhydrase family protein [Vicinamibacterales bacterium]
MIRRFKDLLPEVDGSAYVDPSAQVIGDVVIGAESSVWMNVVIRGDVNRIRIGRRSNVQDLTMVHVMRDTHPTLIGDEVTIGHSAVIHGTTIEDRVLVGMAAVLLNGVARGAGLHHRRGSLLPEGMRVPARSPVMGRPAREADAHRRGKGLRFAGTPTTTSGYRLDYPGAPATEPAP